MTTINDLLAEKLDERREEINGRCQTPSQKEVEGCYRRAHEGRVEKGDFRLLVDKFVRNIVSDAWSVENYRDYADCIERMEKVINTAITETKALKAHMEAERYHG